MPTKDQAWGRVEKPLWREQHNNVYIKLNKVIKCKKINYHVFKRKINLKRELMNHKHGIYFSH